MPGIRRRLLLASVLAFSGPASTASAAVHDASSSIAESSSSSLSASAATDGSLRPPALHPTGAAEPSYYGERGPQRADGSIIGDNASRWSATTSSRSEVPRDGDEVGDGVVVGAGAESYRRKSDRRMNPAHGPRQSHDAAHMDAAISDYYGGSASASASATLAAENADSVWTSWFGGSARQRRRHLEDAGDDDGDDDQVSDEAAANAMCSEYLISFLEGSTDAKDTCEGIMNAFYGADCASTLTAYSDYDGEDEDDYFGEFYEHMCCSSLQTHHSQYCEESKLITNMHLLVVVGVLVLCECAKAVVKKNEINFLPEAAVCILVGAVCGFIAHVTPGSGFDEMSFDEDLFLSVLLPPIIFEAAISVSKPQFRRRRGAIFMLAVIGTMMSSFMSGIMVHFMSKASSSTTIPMLDSLIFGSLISSIDPVAILSVLSSLNLNQKDMIFILVFGESLLNDGVAITLFQSLVERGAWGPNGGITMSTDEVFGAIADFLIVGFGSIGVGLACGILALIYFWMFQNILHPVMEVGSFLLWALIPYYISDGVEWSGIVAIVCMGFFMDMYIASPADAPPITPRAQVNPGGVRPSTPIAASSRALTPAVNVAAAGSHKHEFGQPTPKSTVDETAGHYNNFDFVEDEPSVPTTDLCAEPCGSRGRSLLSLNLRKLLSGNERVRLSSEADKHVRFVAHLTAALCENSIFSYLGLFLYSSTYEWDPTLMSISIAACILSRAFMVVMVCWIFYYAHKVRRKIIQRGATKQGMRAGLLPEEIPVVNMSRTAEKLMDKRMQFVLVLSGLRGAVSLALMENVPIYNAVTGEGCEFKPVLKAMTSASIIFTTFVFGGGAYYILPHMGINPHHEGEADRGPDDGNLPSASDVSSPPRTPRSPRRAVEMANWRWSLCQFDNSAHMCMNDPDPNHMIGYQGSYPTIGEHGSSAEAMSHATPREEAREMRSMI